jgi:chromosome segregation ATPase
MNHLGDTNKMVSETPRTQAVWELFATDTTLEPDVEFSTLARQLERELNAANDRIKRLIRERDEARAERDEAAKVVEKALSELGQVARSRCALIDRIKRLEEALEGTVKWIVRLADSGDAGFWNPEDQSVIIAARDALKKEAKL